MAFSITARAAGEILRRSLWASEEEQEEVRDETDVNEPGEVLRRWVLIIGGYPCMAPPSELEERRRRS